MQYVNYATDNGEAFATPFFVFLGDFLSPSFTTTRSETP